MRAGWAVAILMMGILVGCGSSDTESTSNGLTFDRVLGITLDGRVGPANAGIRLAAEQGHFEDLGLNASTGSPVGPSRPVSYVTRGMDEFGVTQLPQLLIARDRGMPLVAIGSLVPHPTAAMIWLKKSKIGGIEDLKGKTIAIPGLPFQEALLETVLRRAGLGLSDVKVKPVGYALVSALLSGQADAIFGGTWNIEGAALEARGLDPVVKRVEDLGVPAYDELVVITRSDMVAEDPDLVRDVMATVSHGVGAVRRDPAATVQLIEESSESSPELGRKETEAALEATLPLYSTSDRLDPAQARNLAKWMHEEGLIRQEPSPAEFLTNDYLPER